MKKTKKAQIQNMETITVIIIIIVLIIFGIVYATSQRTDSLEQERIRTQDLKAMEIATNALNMNFVKCSEAGASIEACADYYKIKTLNKTTMTDENLMHFYRLFGDSKIKVNIYKNLTAPNEENQKITIYSAPGMENKSQMMIRTPINVRDPVQRKTYFAIMEVTAFR